MDFEAIVPVVGWLALLSLPAVGYWLRRHAGMAVAFCLSVMLLLAPFVVKTDWQESATLAEFVEGYGYLLATSMLISVILVATSPIVLPIALPALYLNLLFGGNSVTTDRIDGFVLVFLVTITIGFVLQVLMLRRFGITMLLAVTSLEVIFSGSFWAIRSHFMRFSIKDGVGYDGTPELIAYASSTMTCALLALCLVALPRLQRINARLT